MEASSKTFDFFIIERIFGSYNPEQKRWRWSARWNLWNVIALEEFVSHGL
jgi:hypothetical protein